MILHYFRGIFTDFKNMFQDNTSVFTTANQRSCWLSGRPGATESSPRNPPIQTNLLRASATPSHSHHDPPRPARRCTRKCCSTDALGRWEACGGREGLWSSRESGARPPEADVTRTIGHTAQSTHRRRARDTYELKGMVTTKKTNYLVM